MITLTTEQAQQIEEALVNLCNSIQLPTSDVKALSTIRAARAQEQAEQEPVCECRRKTDAVISAEKEL